MEKKYRIIEKKLPFVASPRSPTDPGNPKRGKRFPILLTVSDVTQTAIRFHMFSPNFSHMYVLKKKKIFFSYKIYFQYRLHSRMLPRQHWYHSDFICFPLLFPVFFIYLKKSILFSVLDVTQTSFISFRFHMFSPQLSQLFSYI